MRLPVRLLETPYPPRGGPTPRPGIPNECNAPHPNHPVLPPCCANVNNLLPKGNAYVSPNYKTDIPNPQPSFQLSTVIPPPTPSFRRKPESTPANHHSAPQPSFQSPNRHSGASRNLSPPPKSNILRILYPFHPLHPCHYLPPNLCASAPLRQPPADLCRWLRRTRPRRVRRPFSIVPNGV